MTDFRHRTRVRINRPGHELHNATGITLNPVGADEYWIGLDNDTADDRCTTVVKTGELILLDNGPGTPTIGDRVQISADAPYYAGRVGGIESYAVRDDMPGCWLYLTQPEELAWVPAEVLTTLEGGEQR